MKASSAAWKTAGGNLGGNMGLAILLAAMLQAAAADPTQKVYDVEFAPLAPTERQYAHGGPAGPYYPDRAFQAHLSGEGLLRCVAGPAGDLQQCAHAGETPSGSGFADAAMILAMRRRVTAGPGTPVGKPILVRIPFTLGAPVNAMDHPARTPIVRASAPGVRGHAEVGCLATEKGLDGCFVLYFQSMASRPATPAAAFAAMEADTAAALAATAQVVPSALPKTGWVIIPMDITPSATSKP